MNKHFATLAALLAGVGGCAHNDDAHNNNIDPTFIEPVRPTIEDRTKIASSTCEAQYSKDRQNYLAAIESVIAKHNGTPSVGSAPLDRFRAEINGAYNAVVTRCKTHTHCLEVHGYEEAKCYMAASDRKDAERRFADISERLRELELQRARKKKKKPGTSVKVETTVIQSTKQKQSVDTGDDIEDQDVLILCGQAGNLLKKRCRQPCDPGKC